MENNTTELLVTSGPLQGQRFAVPAEGIRLGRSSSCEISIPDPSLSRNQPMVRRLTARSLRRQAVRLTLATV